MATTPQRPHATLKRALTHAERIAKTLGTRSAAGYLRNQGYSVEAALWELCRRPGAPTRRH